MKIKQIILTEEECKKSILDFYDTIAVKMGYKDLEKLQYDCRKILVSKSVFEEIRKHYMDNGTSKESFGMKWCCIGPKANLEDDGFIVEIEDGFIER